ncbi:hypothetical protein OROMI_017763 [Orobanche minor]
MLMEPRSRPLALIIPAEMLVTPPEVVPKTRPSSSTADLSPIPLEYSDILIPTSATCMNVWNNSNRRGDSLRIDDGDLDFLISYVASGHFGAIIVLGGSYARCLVELLSLRNSLDHQTDHAKVIWALMKKLQCTLGDPISALT